MLNKPVFDIYTQGTIHYLHINSGNGNDIWRYTEVTPVHIIVNVRIFQYFPLHLLKSNLLPVNYYHTIDGNTLFIHICAQDE